MHAKANTSQRLLSLDALRGFDMFWIVGGDALFSAISKKYPNPVVEELCAQVSSHLPWEGFRFYDVIFPLFLFIIGVTLPFSLGRHLEEGTPRKTLVVKVLKRALILFLLGWVYNGLFNLDGWDHLRIFGVLQRQALGYLGAALIFLYTKPRTQIAIGAGILVFYSALLAFAPVPGFHPGTYTPEGNFANYIDRLVLMKHQMLFDYGDPEGLLSNLPAVTTALMGVATGYWLKKVQPDGRRLAGLAIAGTACIALALAIMPVIPIIKILWTASYTLLTGGVSMLLLALFHGIIDVKGWTRWAFPFVVIGVNPILIYMLNDIVDFGGTANFFLNGIIKHLIDSKAILIIMGAIVIKWLLLKFLYKQKVFLRV